MTVRVPRHDDLGELAEAGGLGWAPWGTKTFLQCPNNHRAAYGLDDDGHTIAADGTVTPSTRCYADGCEFHEWVILEGWTPP